MHPDKHLPELVAEKNSLDPSFVHAVRLLAEGKSSLRYSEVIAIVMLLQKTACCIAFRGKCSDQM